MNATLIFKFSIDCLINDLGPVEQVVVIVRWWRLSITGHHCDRPVSIDTGLHLK